MKAAVDISWCSRLAGEDQSNYIRRISVNSVFLLTNTEFCVTSVLPDFMKLVISE